MGVLEMEQLLIMSKVGERSPHCTFEHTNREPHFQACKAQGVVNKYFR